MIYKILVGTEIGYGVNSNFQMQSFLGLTLSNSVVKSMLSFKQEAVVEGEALTIVTEASSDQATSATSIATIAKAARRQGLIGFRHIHASLKFHSGERFDDFATFSEEQVAVAGWLYRKEYHVFALNEEPLASH